MKSISYEEFKETLKDPEGNILPFKVWWKQYMNFSFPVRYNWKEDQDPNDRKYFLNKAEEKRQRRINKRLSHVN